MGLKIDEDEYLWDFTTGTATASKESLEMDSTTPNPTPTIKPQNLVAKTSPEIFARKARGPSGRLLSFVGANLIFMDGLVENCYGYSFAAHLLTFIFIFSCCKYIIQGFLATLPPNITEKETEILNCQAVPIAFGLAISIFNCLIGGSLGLLLAIGCLTWNHITMPLLRLEQEEEQEQTETLSLILRDGVFSVIKLVRRVVSNTASPDNMEIIRDCFFISCNPFIIGFTAGGYNLYDFQLLSFSLIVLQLELLAASEIGRCFQRVCTYFKFSMTIPEQYSSNTVGDDIRHMVDCARISFILFYIGYRAEGYLSVYTFPLGFIVGQMALFACVKIYKYSTSLSKDTQELMSGCACIILHASICGYFMGDYNIGLVIITLGLMGGLTAYYFGLEICQWANYYWSALTTPSPHDRVDMWCLIVLAYGTFVAGCLVGLFDLPFLLLAVPSPIIVYLLLLFTMVGTWNWASDPKYSGVLDIFSILSHSYVFGYTVGNSFSLFIFVIGFIFHLSDMIFRLHVGPAMSQGVVRLEQCFHECSSTESEEIRADPQINAGLRNNAKSPRILETSELNDKEKDAYDIKPGFNIEDIDHPVSSSVVFAAYSEPGDKDSNELALEEIDIRRKASLQLRQLELEDLRSKFETGEESKDKDEDNWEFVQTGEI